MAVGAAFNGTSSEIRSNTGNDLTLSSTWSCAGLVYMTDSAVQRTVINFANGGTSVVRIAVDSGNFAVETGADTPPWFSAVSDGNWYFFCVTKASGTVAPKLYLTSDGSTWSKDGAAADAGTLANPSGTISDVWLGDSLGATFWKGDIVAVVLTNTELTGTQAKSLIDYSNWSGLSGVQFNTGASLLSAGTMDDSSANNNDETSRTSITSGAQTVPSWFANWPTSGAPTKPADTVGTPPYPYVVESIGAAISASASPAVTFTQNPEPGDVVLMFPSSTGTGVTLNTVSGWTNLLGGTTDVESDSHEISCLGHDVTAAESAADTKTYTISSLYTVAQTGYVHGLLIRSCRPVAEWTSNSTFDSSNTVTPHVLASITPTVQGGLIVSSVAKDATGAYSSTPGGMTQLLASNTNQGRWTGYYNALGTKGTAVGPTNITPSAGDEYASITVSVAPNYQYAIPPLPSPWFGPATTIDFVDRWGMIGDSDGNLASPDRSANAGNAAVTVTANQASTDVRPNASSASVTFTANNPTASIKPSAGNAAVTFTANAASLDVRPNASSASVTITANNPTAAVSPSAGTAAVTFTANAASTAVAPSAGNAAVTFTANQPTAAVSPTAGVATFTFTANQPTITTGSDVAANAGNAAVTFTANNPTAAVSPSAGNAALTFTANQATASVAVSASSAAVTFTANQPTAAVSPSAGVATFTFTANQPTITTSGSTNAPAGNAAITYTANGPSISVKVNAGVATISVAAAQPTAAISPSAGVASMSWAANQAKASVSATALYALILFTANDATTNHPDPTVMVFGALVRTRRPRAVESARPNVYRTRRPRSP